MPEAQDVTALLHDSTTGSVSAADRLLAVVYDELRRMARRFLLKERADHTLQATELVHEAYLRLIDQTRCEWHDRVHFMAVASMAMRRILVDHARRRKSLKRSADRKLSLEAAATIGTGEPGTLMLDLDRALARLAVEFPEVARLMEMRIFGGLTHAECATALGISPRTASRHWEFGQAWMYRELEYHDGPD